MTWELDHLCNSGLLGPDDARRLDELTSTTDPDRAAELAIVIESGVAPVSGGLSDAASGVVSALVAALPRMSPATRPAALSLLTQVAGSSLVVSTAAAVETRRLVETSIPVVAAVIELGTEDETAQVIHLISVSAAGSPAAAERAASYLARIAAGTSGAIRSSAQRELEDVRSLLERGHPHLKTTGES
ncbi:hypothetical protein ACFUMH_13745 [Cellulomonas sp. NPDC057328]|uniref:hypothetical protein n=1 Tax=Cellulomonas sp. NPDC057328 TaxID=3346101 RepID=UPI00363CD402